MQRQVGIFASRVVRRQRVNLSTSSRSALTAKRVSIASFTTEATSAATKLPFRPGSPEDPWGQGNVTIHSWNRQLLDMIEANKHDEAKALYAKMEAGQGPKPNIPTYHIMMNLYRKIFDYNTVAELDKKLHDSLIARKPNNRIRGVATKNISRPYRPKYRTGSWAMLIALLRSNNDQGLTKQELIEAAQPLCDTSFTEPTDYNGFYSSWSSMSTLRNKNLVSVLRTGDAATTRYSLTEDGKHMAQELDAEERDPSSAVIHAMETKLNEDAAANGGNSAAGAASWFSAELNDRLSSKLQLDTKQIEKIRGSVDGALSATEPARRKQLAAVLLALDSKEGSKAVDNAIKKSKNPGEVAEVAEILRSKNLLSAAK